MSNLIVADIDCNEYLEGKVRQDVVGKHRQAIKRELDETLCRECPLQKPCRLTLAIHRKDICQILRAQDGGKTNESTRINGET